MGSLKERMHSGINARLTRVQLGLIYKENLNKKNFI